jgi:hypothetical protein
LPIIIVKIGNWEKKLRKMGVGKKEINAAIIHVNRK